MAHNLVIKDLVSIVRIAATARFTPNGAIASQTGNAEPTVGKGAGIGEVGHENPVPDRGFRENEGRGDHPSLIP